MDVGAADIRRWHRAQGWADIGYHYVIRRSGKVEAGRPVDAIGSHVKGHNVDSVGICLVGGLNNETFKPENNYTPQQWESLIRLLKTLRAKYPKAKVRGHRDFPNVHKACPCFNAIPWAKKNGFPT
jgi:N-acetylmuramoyl-L-alanine amidase